jgi:hypothetical protein
MRFRRGENKNQQHFFEKYRENETRRLDKPAAVLLASHCQTSPTLVIVDGSI